MQAIESSPRPYPDVLIMDDDPVVIAALTDWLTASGYSVVSACTGEALIRAARTLRPRLVILDIGMPDLDGYAVCRHLRQQPWTLATPLLFLSSQASVDARVCGLRAGAIDFIAKPCERAELIARVDAQFSALTERDTLCSRFTQLVTRHKGLRSRLSAARRVQEAMLPQDTGEGPIRFAWRCLACEHIGGDMINVIRLSDKEYAFYVLDASGHGPPAAMLAVAAGAAAAALLRERSGSATERVALPSDLLDSLGRSLAGRMTPGSFVSILAGHLDLRAGRLGLASAGHPGPLLLRAGGQAEFLDTPAPPAGLSCEPHRTNAVPVGPGDRILLYSDGAYEQPNESGIRYGRERLRRVASAVVGRDPGELIDHITADLALWRGARGLEDDCSLLAIACQEGVGDDPA
jgi:sigma-B regulation protein RsbU (phosphoserine phosphatase)